MVVSPILPDVGVLTDEAAAKFCRGETEASDFIVCEPFLLATEFKDCVEESFAVSLIDFEEPLDKATELVADCNSDLESARDSAVEVELLFELLFKLAVFED